MPACDDGFWDQRAGLPGLHAVLSRRWTAEQCRVVDQAEQDLLLDRLPAGGGAPLLDVGSGIGRLTAALARRAPAVVSLDLSFAMLRRGRQPLAPAVQADAAMLPFGAGVFGTVVTSGVLQHIAADRSFEMALREIVRVLRPGGHALFVEGLREASDPAGGSKTTFARPLPDYTAVLTPALRLRDQADFLRVADQYAVLVWEKGGPG